MWPGVIAGTAAVIFPPLIIVTIAALVLMAFGACLYRGLMGQWPSQPKRLTTVWANARARARSPLGSTGKEENMRALGLIPLLALAACSAQQQAVTVPPGTCVVDVQDEPFFTGGLLSIANGHIAERNTQRRAYARAHQSPDCPAEATRTSSATAEMPPHDDGVAAAVEQGNIQNWLAQQQNNFWQMQNWQAQQQGNFWDMVGAIR
jgi:hypothetical protein